MTVTTRVKSIINSGLNRVGLHLDTLTAYRQESARLQDLERAGYFDKPAFPIPPSFNDVATDVMFGDLALHARRFEDLSDPAQNPVGFGFDNGFFTSPDAEVLYCMIRRYEPRTIVEVGSGSSTKISRLALMDGEIDSQLISIDPHPRAEIDALTDRAYRVSVENLADLSVFSLLGENDILFIDSSHELRPGNDLTHLYLCVFPILASGVLVHIHDIFLPYDYRSDWILDLRLPYAEQYLVQTMLQSEDRFEVIWPGYYLQRTLGGFSTNFPCRKAADAQSLWLKTR